MEATSKRWCNKLWLTKQIALDSVFKPEFQATDEPNDMLVNPASS